MWFMSYQACGRCSGSTVSWCWCCVVGKAGPPLYIISAYNNIWYRPIYRPYMHLVPYSPYMAVGHIGRLARFIGRE
jgi:hypothetical protein